MTLFVVSYDSPEAEIPLSADAGENGNRESFLTGAPTNREDSMNRTVAPAGIAHYYSQLAKLSTRYYPR